ncbi:MAG: transcription antitermination factor NusB [Calditrichaeota bacterium]|nr:transcription antitermination factor NusB [Calditrichota bacterium]
MAKSGRRIAREYALQSLYAYEMTQENLDKIIDDIINLRLKDEKTRAFSELLVRRVVGHQKELDQMIRNKAINWDFTRIAIIDKLILRMGISEFLFFEDIPPKVTINEAIEIAKKFSTEKSGSFINGILDSILNDLKKSGKLHKSGRGLLDVKLEL